MNFPIMPMIPFFANFSKLVGFDKIITLVFCVSFILAWLWLWVGNAIHNSYNRYDSVSGLVCLLTAALFATTGVFNIVVGVTFIVTVFVFVKYVLWKFLIVFLIWKGLIKNILAIASGGN